MPAPDPSAVATATLAAHLLSEAGSGIVRALDLLELLGWREEVEPVRAALNLANRKVCAVRQVVDGHIDAIRARTLGRPVDPNAIALLEMGQEELAR